MYKINKIANSNIFFSIAFIITPMLNPYAILYSLANKILCVTHLYLIETQYMIFVLLITLVR